MDSNDVIRRATRFVADAKDQAVYNHDSQLASDVEYKGLTNMVDALIEVGIKDKQIVEIVQKYYRNYTFDELEHLVSAEKTIGVPVIQLVEYLHNEHNYLYNEAWDYISYNHVSTMLARDRELYKQPPEKLYELIEKDEH